MSATTSGDILARYPDRFRAYGAVPFFHPDQAVEETTRALDDLGFDGIAINALPAENKAITDEEYTPLFEELDRRSSVLYIHPSGNAA